MLNRFLNNTVEDRLTGEVWNKSSKISLLMNVPVKKTGWLSPLLLEWIFV